MKVVLLKDVAGVGQKGSVKQVADGYAMNYLIPQRLAEAVTVEQIVKLEKQEREAEVARERERAHAVEVAKHLEGAFVTLRVSANEEGHLYGQIQPDAIVARIQAECGVSVPASAINITIPIKSLGRVVVQVRLGERRVPITVSVERET